MRKLVIILAGVLVLTGCTTLKTTPDPEPTPEPVTGCQQPTGSVMRWLHENFYESLDHRLVTMVNTHPIGNSEWWIVALPWAEDFGSPEEGIKFKLYTPTWLTNAPSDPQNSRWISVHEGPGYDTPVWDHVEWPDNRINQGQQAQQLSMECASEIEYDPYRSRSSYDPEWIPDPSYFLCKPANLNHLRASYEPEKDTSTAYGSAIIDAVEVLADFSNPYQYGYHIIVAKLENPTAPGGRDIVSWVFYKSDTPHNFIYEIPEDWNGGNGFVWGSDESGGRLIPWGITARTAAINCLN